MRLETTFKYTIPHGWRWMAPADSNVYLKRQERRRGRRHANKFTKRLVDEHTIDEFIDQQDEMRTDIWQYSYDRKTEEEYWDLKYYIESEREDREEEREAYYERQMETYDPYEYDYYYDDLDFC